MPTDSSLTWASDTGKRKMYHRKRIMAKLQRSCVANRFSSLLWTSRRFRHWNLHFTILREPESCPRLPGEGDICFPGKALLPAMENFGSLLAISSGVNQAALCHAARQGERIRSSSGSTAGPHPLASPLFPSLQPVSSPSPKGVTSGQCCWSAILPSARVKARLSLSAIPVQAIRCCGHALQDFCGTLSQRYARSTADRAFWIGPWASYRKAKWSVLKYLQLPKVKPVPNN